MTYFDLYRQLVEFKIELFRFDSYQNRQLMKLISERSPVIKGLVMSVNDKTTKAEMRQIVSAIKAESKSLFSSMNNQLFDDWAELYAASNAIEVSIYNKFVGLDAFKTTKMKMRSPEIEGVSFDKWWQRTQSAHDWRIEKIISARRSGQISADEYNGAYIKAMKDTRRNVTTVMRTSNAWVASQGRERLEIENANLFSYKQQVSTLDGRTTPICRARDGLKWDMNNNPIGHKFVFLQPPLHFGCRTIIVFVLDDENRAFGTRASQFGQVDERMDYNAWIKEQPNAYQDKILGKTAAGLFRAGKITMQDMVNQDGRPLSIKQLKARYNVI